MRSAVSASEPDFGSDPGLDANVRAARRRRLGAQRHEDVDHERQRERRRDRVGEHGRRHPFRRAVDAPGFSAPDIHRKLSLRASVTSELVMDDVRLPAGAVLPGVEGLTGPLSCLNEARYGIVWGVMGPLACASRRR